MVAEERERRGGPGTAQGGEPGDAGRGASAAGASEAGAPEAGASEAVASERRVSERLCAGCRRVDERDALLRFAVGPEAPYLAPDPQRRLGGRGVSVHPSRACVELAARKGGFARALRKSVAIDAGALCSAAAALYEKRAESLLLAAARRKLLAIGTDAVREALRGRLPVADLRDRKAGAVGAAGAQGAVESHVELLLVAEDADGRREELRAQAERIGRRCVVMGTKESLGRLFGRSELGVLGILDRDLADEVVRCVTRASALSSGSPGSRGDEPGMEDRERGDRRAAGGGTSSRQSEAE